MSSTDKGQIKNNASYVLVSEIMKDNEIKGDFINCFLDGKNCTANPLIRNMPLAVRDIEGNKLYKKSGFLKKEEIYVKEILGNTITLSHPVEYPVIIWYWIKLEEGRRVLMYKRFPYQREIEELLCH